jgi:hypothetical protein
MEAIGTRVEFLQGDLRQVIQLVEDAASDAELLDSQPYQRARLMALRLRLFNIAQQLQNLRSDLGGGKQSSHWTRGTVEEFDFTIA